MYDPNANYSPGLTGPAGYAAAATPDDANDLPVTSRAIWVGGGGSLRVTTAGNQTVTFAGVPSGTLIPVRVARVWATGTTATLIVSVW